MISRYANGISWYSVRASAKSLNHWLTVWYYIDIVLNGLRLFKVCVDHLFIIVVLFMIKCVCVWYQNITAQKTPGRLTRNNVRNTPCRPTAAPSVAPADQTGSPVVGQVRSPNVETRSGLPAVARGQTGSPKGPTSSQRPPMGKLHSPAVQKISSDKLRSPASEKSPHPVESSFVKDFGPDVGLERFNTTESDEDIAKVCGQMEDEVGLHSKCNTLCRVMAEVCTL